MQRLSRHDAGFTYLVILFFVAIMGAILAVTGVMWSTAQQREKERDLLFVGNEFRKAIADYYERTPGTIKRYPNSFNDLLKDNRQLATVRYLRRIYVDPITAESEWGTVHAPDGGIMGVYSLSTEPPLKHSGFLRRDSSFERADTYAKWRFIYEPQNRVSADSNKGVNRN